MESESEISHTIIKLVTRTIPGIWWIKNVNLSGKNNCPKYLQTVVGLSIHSTGIFCQTFSTFYTKHPHISMECYPCKLSSVVVSLLGHHTGGSLAFHGEIQAIYSTDLTSEWDHLSFNITKNQLQCNVLVAPACKTLYTENCTEKRHHRSA